MINTIENDPVARAESLPSQFDSQNAVAIKREAILLRGIIQKLESELGLLKREKSGYDDNLRILQTENERLICELRDQRRNNKQIEIDLSRQSDAHNATTILLRESNDVELHKLKNEMQVAHWNHEEETQRNIIITDERVTRFQHHVKSTTVIITANLLATRDEETKKHSEELSIIKEQYTTHVDALEEEIRVLREVSKRSTLPSTDTSALINRLRLVEVTETSALQQQARDSQISTLESKLSQFMSANESLLVLSKEQDADVRLLQLENKKLSAALKSKRTLISSLIGPLDTID